MIPPSTNKKERSFITAYILWLFFGLLGAHRFYLGRKISGFILLFTTLFWIISFAISGEELYGVLWLVKWMSPIEPWLIINLGTIGRWISALLYLPIFFFPAFWWLTDAFRIPRLRKMALNDDELV